METAKDIQKILRKNKLTFINVEKVINKLGYSVVFFNTPKGDFEIERYNLAKQAETLKSFTYAKTARIVFIDGDLHSDDKLYLSLHELGHIVLGHVGDGKLITRNSILIDIEADNFVHSIMYPQKENIFFALVVAIILSASILFSTYYICNQDEPVQTQTVSTQNFVQTDISQSDLTHSDVVYVTPSGKKFHRADCRYVKNKTNLKEFERDNATIRYEPCSVCKP